MNTVIDGGECGGVWNLGIGPLLLSLGITLLLVGALFYYVKQRIEVLETSQKEQIHVMQSFIASIGEQFQRMSAYIQEKVGSIGYQSHIHSSNQVPPQTQVSDSRVNISESESSDSASDSNTESDSDSDSEYESSDNSRSSNTTRDSDRNFDQGTKFPQIKIHDVNTMDNVKIIELTPSQIEPYHEQEQEQIFESDPESEESETESESDSETESESKSESVHNDANVPVHVTKIDSEQSQSPSQSHGQSPSQSQKKTLVIDLDLDGNLDGQVGTTTTTTTSSDYATLTIKQLRQLLKKKNPSMLMNDIAKMKREQIVEMLQV